MNYRNKALFSVSVAFMVILMGCSSSVYLRIRRAPEINLVGVEAVKVVPFTISGDINLGMIGNRTGLGRVVGAMGNKGVELVVGQLKHEDFSQYHAQAMKKNIAHQGQFVVVEGPAYDAQVSGHLQYTVTDDVTQVEELNEDSVKVLMEKIIRRVNVDVTFSILDQQGKVYGGGAIKAFKKSVAKDVSKFRVREKLQPWDEMIEQALILSCGPFLQKIAPYEVTEKRTLEKGDHKAIKKANKLAKKGEWMAAMDIWKGFENAGNRKNKTASHFNQGVYDEIEGRLEGALEHFNIAKETSGNPKYNYYINGVLKRMDDEAQMNGLE